MSHHNLSRLRFYHIAWLNIKVAFFVWGCLLVFYPRSSPIFGLNRTLGFVIGLFFVVGSFFSVYGILSVLADKTKFREYGYFYELFGLVIIAQGALAFFVTRAAYALAYPSTQRLSASIVSYLLFSFVYGRVTVLKQARKEGHIV